MILRYQQSVIEVRHEKTSVFQDWNLPLVVNHFILKVSLMGFFQVVTNTVH